MKIISPRLITQNRIKQWKTVFLILFLVFQTGNIFARGTKSDVKQNDTLVFENQYQYLKYLIDNKQFVLTADYLQNWGYRRFVNSTINFVKVDSTTAVIQIGSDYRIGPNGVGGVTAKGKISNWKVKENPKSESFTIDMSVMTPLGIYFIMFNIYSTGYSTARLTGLSAGQLTFEGNIVPLSDSGTFEGSSF